MKRNHLRVSVALLALMGTSTAEADDWGRHATIAPGWERLRHSALHAARDPMTWIPAVAAVGVFASGQDERWAKDLHENAPVFGSPEKANDQSDRYRLAAEVLWKVSMLATDSGDQTLRNKAKGILVQVAAVNATHAVTNELKHHVDRAEPGAAEGEADGNAFPSNHATDAFAHAALIRQNLRETSLPRPVSYGMITAGYIAASGSAWGRIEAGAHHISDQLMGAAIGNFVASFINEAFMGEDRSLSIGYAPSGQVEVMMTFYF